MAYPKQESVASNTIHPFLIHLHHPPPFLLPISFISFSIKGNSDIGDVRNGGAPEIQEKKGNPRGEERGMGFGPMVGALEKVGTAQKTREVMLCCVADSLFTLRVPQKKKTFHLGGKLFEGYFREEKRAIPGNKCGSYIFLFFFFPSWEEGRQGKVFAE
jgi:hypothetical protein